MERGKNMKYITSEDGAMLRRIDAVMLRARLVRIDKDHRSMIRLELLKELIERGVLHVHAHGSDLTIDMEVGSIESMINTRDPMSERVKIAEAVMSYQSTPRGDTFPELPENDHTGQRIGGPIQVDDGPDFPY